ncbi:hypothetical protein LCGC14_2821450, partial [marine sediment metagenome]
TGLVVQGGQIITNNSETEVASKPLL